MKQHLACSPPFKEMKLKEQLCGPGADESHKAISGLFDEYISTAQFLPTA